MGLVGGLRRCPHFRGESKGSEVCSQFSGKPWKDLKQGSVMIGMTLELIYAGLFRTDYTGVTENNRETRWEVIVVVWVRGDMMKADGLCRNGRVSCM